MKTNAFIILMAALCLDTYAQSDRDNKSPGYEKKTFVYKTVEGTPIHADWYETSGNASLRPVIVWIHGGALMGGSRTMPEDQKKFYLDAGYSIVSIDYRLAPETKLPAIIDDVQDAVAWVRKNGAMLKIDPARTFIIGHSAGGYLTLMLGSSLKNPPKGIVSFYGYGDIQADWYSKPDSFYLTKDLVDRERAMKLIGDSVITSSTWKDRGTIYLYSRQNGLWPLLVGGHDPLKEAKWFYQYCPLRNVHANYPPALLIHGDQDTDVPFEQSVLMHRELESKKIRHQFMPLKNYGHGFDHADGGLSNPDIKKIFDDVLAFLNSCE